jgi:hypothetical protein
MTFHVAENLCQSECLARHLSSVDAQNDTTQKHGPLEMTGETTRSAGIHWRAPCTVIYATITKRGFTVSNCIFRGNSYGFVVNRFDSGAMYLAARLVTISGCCGNRWYSDAYGSFVVMVQDRVYQFADTDIVSSSLRSASVQR